MKKYEIWKINERGVYELVEATNDGHMAGVIAKALRARGMWIQVCEHGKNTINGASR